MNYRENNKKDNHFKYFYKKILFSPIMINLEQTLEMFENGLDYIKFSIECVDDIRHKEVRGKASNFTGSYHSILQLHERKEKNNLEAAIVITMLNLNKPW